MSGWLDGIVAVTFDVGGTLIEPWPSVGQVYATLAARAGVSGLDAEELNRRFARVWQGRANFDFQKKSWRSLVETVLAGLVPVAVQGELFAAVWQGFTEAAAWRVFPEVPPCLTALRARGLRCGVISNWDERLTPTLRNVGLLGAFEFVLASGEVGHAKPAPEIFRRAQRLLEVPPAAILHVGDSAREDVTGARAAGFRGVLLDRSGAGRGDVARLTDLLEAGVSAYGVG